MKQEKNRIVPQGCQQEEKSKKVIVKEPFLCMLTIGGSFKTLFLYS